MVPKAGLEPAHPKAVDFESTASTDFATSALKYSENGGHYTCQKTIRNTYPFNPVQVPKKESFIPRFCHSSSGFNLIYHHITPILLAQFFTADRQPINSLYNSKQYTAMR